MTRQTKEQFDKNKIKKLSESELTFQWSKYHPAISDTTINSKVLKNKSRCYSLFSRRAPPYWSDVTRDSQLGEVGARGKKNSEKKLGKVVLGSRIFPISRLIITMSAHWVRVNALLRGKKLTSRRFRLPSCRERSKWFSVDFPLLSSRCALCRQSRRSATQRSGAVNLQLDPEEKQQLDRPFWERRGFSITTWGVEGCPKRATEPSRAE